MSFNDKVQISIFNYPELEWIEVSVVTWNGRITKLKQEFKFSYPKNRKKWGVRAGGHIEFWSPLGLRGSIWTFWERDNIFYCANSDHKWMRTQLDVLQKLIETGRRFDPYKEQPHVHCLDELFVFPKK